MTTTVTVALLTMGCVEKVSSLKEAKANAAAVASIFVGLIVANFVHVNELLLIIFSI